MFFWRIHYHLYNRSFTTNTMVKLVSLVKPWLICAYHGLTIVTMVNLHKGSRFISHQWQTDMFNKVNTMVTCWGRSGRETWILDCVRGLLLVTVFTRSRDKCCGERDILIWLNDSSLFFFLSLGANTLVQSTSWHSENVKLNEQIQKRLC